jgi:hypothetical protein
MVSGMALLLTKPWTLNLEFIHPEPANPDSPIIFPKPLPPGAIYGYFDRLKPK